MEIMGWRKGDAAMQIVLDSIARYAAKYAGTA